MTYAERVDAKANEAELLTAYANATTGASDLNLGDAVRTLVGGYGKGGGGPVWKEAIINAVATNAYSLLAQILPTVDPAHTYLVVLKKEKDRYVTDQMVFAVVSPDGRTAASSRYYGNGLRYRGGLVQVYATNDTQYTATAEIGDTYLWIDTADLFS